MLTIDYNPVGKCHSRMHLLQNSCSYGNYSTSTIPGRCSNIIPIPFPSSPSFGFHSVLIWICSLCIQIWNSPYQPGSSAGWGRLDDASIVKVCEMECGLISSKLNQTYKSNHTSPQVYETLTGVKVEAELPPSFSSHWKVQLRLLSLVFLRFQGNLSICTGWLFASCF